MASTIPPDQQGVFGINVFRIAPEDQQLLIDCLRGIGPTSGVPGLISLRLLRSLDGQRMVNYMHWTSPAAFEKAGEIPAVAGAIQRAGELVTDGNPGLFQVVHLQP